MQESRAKHVGGLRDSVALGASQVLDAYVWGATVMHGTCAPREATPHVTPRGRGVAG